MVLENDYTRDPQKFVIIAAVRSGGTLLAHSLDSHPLISCTRGEPLHALSEWRHVGITETLNILTNMTGYLASGLKLQNDQLSYGPVMPFLVNHKVKVIRLTRENIVAQAISLVINRMSRRKEIGIPVPQHSFTAISVPPIEISVKRVLHAIEVLEISNTLTSLALKEYPYPILSLTYEQLTLGKVKIRKIPPMATDYLCSFLGVPRLLLENYLHRINSKPYSEALSNWQEIKSILANTKYKDYLCQM